MTEFVGFPKIARFNRPWIITEKIDGTNAQVLIVPREETNEGAVAVVGDLALYAGSRTRFITPENDNQGFARWVLEHAEELAGLGVGAHFGEWWGLGIQRSYGLNEKRFSLFNVHKWGTERPGCCHVVPWLAGSASIESLGAIASNCIAMLRRDGSTAAPGFMRPEGIVMFHAASSQLYKITLEKDEEPKSAAEWREKQGQQ